VAGRAGAGVGLLNAASTDGLTLLGNQRALDHDVDEAATNAAADRPFAAVLVQLEDLLGVNEDIGYAAGDHLIQVAARNAQRPSSSHRRAQPTADRVRRRIVGPHRHGGLSPGDRAADVLGRARDSLTRAEP
jgi:hypothetical protein